MAQMTVPIIRQSDLPVGYCYPADPETFFEDIVDRIVGAQPYPVIKGRIDKLIAPVTA